MFTIKNILFRCWYEKGIVFLSTHKSNYKDFIQYEKNCVNDPCMTIYASSVSLTDRNIELNLSIDKDCGGTLQQDTLYDVVVKYMKFNKKTQRMVYKIMKVMISDDELDEEIKEDEETTNDLFDSYEITEMFNHIRRVLCEKIDGERHRLARMHENVYKMEANLTNLNAISDMNNNFDKF